MKFPSIGTSNQGMSSSRKTTFLSAYRKKFFHRLKCVNKSSDMPQATCPTQGVSGESRYRKEAAEKPFLEARRAQVKINGAAGLCIRHALAEMENRL
jgi:hypothetical protein